MTPYLADQPLITFWFSPGGEERLRVPMREGARWRRVPVGVHAAYLLALPVTGEEDRGFLLWWTENVRGYKPQFAGDVPGKFRHAQAALRAFWVQHIVAPKDRHLFSRLVDVPVVTEEGIRQESLVPVEWVANGTANCRFSPMTQEDKPGWHRLGWKVECWTTWDAACAELTLMAEHKVRAFRMCPECGMPSWKEKRGYLCALCADKTGVASRKRFLNALNQAKHAGRLTEEERKHLLGVLRERGLEDAQKEYEAVKARRLLEGK